MPFITVYDLVLNEEKNELVAGTFARSIMSFPLDSVDLVDDPITSVQMPLAQKVNPIKIYPNPASNYINVEIQNIELDRSLEVVIIDANGKMVYNNSTQAGANFSTQINIADWSPGVYSVKSKNRHQISTNQFVKIE